MAEPLCQVVCQDLRPSVEISVVETRLEVLALKVGQTQVRERLTSAPSTESCMTSSTLAVI